MVSLSSSSSNAMEVLVTELNFLLELLDHETLSSPTEEKKTSVRNLLKQLEPIVTGPDYLYMNTSVYRNGTSFVESLFETFDCDLGELKDMTEDQKQKHTVDTHTDTHTDTHVDTHVDTHRDDTSPSKQSSSDSSPPRSSETPPPLPTNPPPEAYYEEAVPLSPGKQPEYITTRGSSSPPNSIEDGYYEDAENNSPPTCINGRQRKNSYNDSDALSSSYESYEEDEEEKGSGPGSTLTHQWPSDESSMLPARDCRICAFLLRKKRFGQWAKQLTVIRDNRLQCYKSSKDVSPYVDLPLPQCTVTYAPKDERRKRHELRFTPPSGEALVLAVQSREQAHRWLRVVRKVSQGKGPEESTSPMMPRKTALDKRLSGDRTMADSDSVGVTTGENNRDNRENGKVKWGALAAGRKITRIISFSKRKHPLPGNACTPSPDTDPRRGYLSVLVSQVWRDQWCCVHGGSLHFHPDRGDPRPSLAPLPLHRCEVFPGLGPKHPFTLRILKGGTEVAVLEACSSEELGRWLGVLMAETGTATDPESLHYDYVDVETIANIRDAARHSFLWATSSSSTSSDSRTYDEVPCEGEQPEEVGGLKRRSSFSSKYSGRTKPGLALKYTGSNTNQYGLYGKTRAEEDTKHYLRKKEELEREKDGIRNNLLTLRQERREVKEKLKTATEEQRGSLSEHVSQLDEAFRGKESERVDLELRLTQVKDNLNKSLAGGGLGAPGESKPSSKVYSSPYYSESIPVSCVSEALKKPPVYSSSKGTVMQKAKEWESRKCT
ncbi:actin filament-associated protein 1-like 1 isoform X2 [Coregonus clupeaformis]|uniref:actin filament-associated protein 1-like 1 isoform X2 n=1 Tax=Coregonus clupeaformis TaxID=59861 RepID=UPI001E1C536A|nr:actin filament-associated protein 1-like 1 isoform X2 [Coregonus clupeaformis]